MCAIAFACLQGYTFVAPSVLFTDNMLTDKCFNGIEEHKVLRVNHTPVTCNLTQIHVCVRILYVYGL